MLALISYKIKAISQFFNFANFSHNFEAKLESNRSDLQLITPSSGGDYDASAVFSVNHDDVITYTTSVACSETQASSSVVDPLERVRRSVLIWFYLNLS